MSYIEKENKFIDADRVSALLRAGELGELESMVASHHPVDIAKLMEALHTDDAKRIFEILPPQVSSETIMELSDEVREHILEDMESKRVGEIVDLMPSDDAADLLGGLPEEEADKVLEYIPEEDTRQVKSLLAFDKDTAGGIMQAEVISVSPENSVREVVALLRESKDDLEDIHNIFVTGAFQKLVGVLPVRRLVLEDPQTLVVDIMDEDAVSADVDQDQEEIARIFKKYDLISLPVVDGRHRLLGRITIDDIIDVMEEEATEDFIRMAGAGHDDTLPMSTLKNTRKRLPWLFASCIGGIIALKVIGAYESILGHVVALASFMPVILGMGGNVGTQSTTIIVRGLATGSVNVRSLWKVVLKEIRIGILLGSFYGLFLAVITEFVYPGNPLLSLSVGLSMFASMCIASAVGSVTPLLLHKIGVDPAVATGPFVTTSVDIMGIVVFFKISSLILF